MQLELFYSWLNEHLTHSETVTTDEGEETYFRGDLVGGYSFETGTYYLNKENEIANKLYSMWETYTS
ncbi:hypothetical protein [Vibrio mediterranei]|uniref:hypothetical protein n=1 Tax=Vibrio mediterranei TaxID=689 RepID=UPI004068D803